MIFNIKESCKMKRNILIIRKYKINVNSTKSCEIAKSNRRIDDKVIWMQLYHTYFIHRKPSTIYRINNPLVVESSTIRSRIREQWNRSLNTMNIRKPHLVNGEKAKL